MKLISWLKPQSMMIHYYFAFLWRELTFQLNANLGSLLEGEKQRLFCCSCPLILDHLFVRIYLERFSSIPYGANGMELWLFLDI